MIGTHRIFPDDLVALTQAYLPHPRGQIAMLLEGPTEKEPRCRVGIKKPGLPPVIFLVSPGHLLKLHG